MNETEQSPGGEAVTPVPSDGDPTPGEQGNSLDTKDVAELVDMIRGLRSESASYRTRAKAAEEKLGESSSRLDEMSTRMTELESLNKTVEEQEQERLLALEARASQVDALEPYQLHVKAQYEAGFANVEGMDDGPEKQKFTDLLNSFGEQDYLGRLRVLQALEVVQKKQERHMEPGDQGNPGEPGGGASEASLADKLGWSTEGLREAKLAGLIK
jgi:hypothetical protein